MSGRPVVVIPGDFPPMVGRSRYLDDLRQIADVIIYHDRPQSIEEKRRRLEPADILLNSRGAVQFTSEVISELPKLKMIAVCGIGYDAIHLPSATAAGIVVSNIPGKTAVVVAEHALALMLGTARRLPSMTNDVRSGHWSGNLGMSLAGRQVGIVVSWPVSAGELEWMLLPGHFTRTIRRLLSADSDMWSWTNY
jgi:phosphoglycerate dehydrogenase-like enzyme